jgi:hypothetical protein
MYEAYVEHHSERPIPMLRHHCESAQKQRKMKRAEKQREIKSQEFAPRSKLEQ